MNATVDSNTSFEQSLSSVLHFVVSEYFSSFFAICVITSKSSLFKPSFFDSKVFLFEFNELNEDTRKLYKQGVETGCQAFVIDDEVFPNFLADFYEVHDDCVQVFSNKHVVVYQSVMERVTDETQASYPAAIDDLPNILFVDYKNETFHLSTTMYVGLTDNSKLVTLTRISQEDNLIEKLAMLDLFPEKRLNMQGREVVLALFNYMPYVLWEEVPIEAANSKEKLLKTPLEIDGTESWLFIEFCKKLNCSLLISLDEAGEWGEIADNRTGNGILGAVAEKRAEIGVGALYSWYHESLFLSLSKPISRTGITCITPKPSLLDPIGTPLLPFSTNLWLAVLGSYLLSGIFYKALRKLQGFVEGTSRNKETTEETISEIFLNMLGIFVLQSVKINFRQLSIMFFFTSVLIVGLMIGNSYSSALSSVLTIPRFEKAVDTVEELAESKMGWGSTHDAWIFSIQLATQPMIVQLLSTFHTFSKEVLEQHAIKQDFSFSIERLPYGHYAIGEYVTEQAVNNYQIMLNDIYYELCVAMSTKTWPLMAQLDELILQMAESGVQQFVELDVVMRNSNNKIQRAVAHSRHKESIGPIKLTPAHLIGPYIILGFGLLVSANAFIFETVLNHYKQKRERQSNAWE